MILGILLVYFIWKRFSELAFEHNQKKWIYGLLGILCYYLGTLIGGAIIGVLSVFMDFDVNWDNDLLMSVIALPFGIGTCYLFYYLLKKKWEKEAKVYVEGIQDIGKRDEE
jgi:MFS family permease